MAMTAPKPAWTLPFFLALLVACGGSTESPESTACANLASLSPCSAAGTDVDACIDGLAELRTQHGGDDACRTEYDVLVACLGALDACPTGSGVLCNEELTALTGCGAAR